MLHAARYADLRTNLPREVMSFNDFPFIPAAMEGRSHDARRFPKHTEVMLCNSTLLVCCRESVQSSVGQSKVSGHRCQACDFRTYTSSVG